MTSYIVRKDYTTLTPTEKVNFAYAIRVMKTLPITNPHSWAFQVKIHGGPITLVQPTWGTCQHGNCFFLAWHRMYLYYFERILRKYMIGPSSTKPALPYWNYTANGNVPSDFYTPASITTNPLYDAKRNPTMNAYGGSIPISITTDITTAMANANFYAFQNALLGPHASLHGAIGTAWFDVTLGSFQTGDMNNTAIASNDPLFFLHHANVDKIWEKWLAMGNTNPNKKCDAAWWKMKFTFYDENKNPVTISGSQIVALGTDCLGYKYDSVKINKAVAAPSICPSLSNCPTFPAIIIYKVPDVYINGSLYKMDFSATASSKTYDSIVTTAKSKQFNFNPNGTGDNVILEFENINSIKPPAGVLEIYVNPKGMTVKDLQPQTASFAGLLDLFTATASQAHKDMHAKEEMIARININHVLKKLELSLADLKKLRIVFVARGNNKNGKEVTTTTEIKIGQVALTLNRN
jgi:Common central domain of tyrosinase/Polyphenol oxidase middle domain